ncbi:MarR family winged helix-turn-helix transcriptional regulator [Actinoplanes subtropicus]|uniref:MarR family winged helix-turn-helix transcriptional regulator n=1 Tax=Actinoplanes subtropicus TaxID=543632 RepID=UPI0004C3A6AF|nr:MarR family transcriptional regulator [Actinoplanes subtropicus]
MANWQDGLPYVVYRAQQAVHRRAQAAIDSLDVTLTQLGLAVHLDELGLMSASELARRFHLTPQSVTTALAQLERAGWVRRRPHPVHRRVVLHELTEMGLAGVAEGRQRIAEVDALFTDLLPDGARDELIGQLKALAIALEGEDPDIASAWPIARPAAG